MNLRYSITIRWSDEDNAYLVELPELYGKGRFATHGDSYEEALKNGLEVMELLVDVAGRKSQDLPAAETVTSSVAS